VIVPPGLEAMSGSSTRAAVVLAGGGSRRMGVSKAWLDLRGVPVLLHVLREVSHACGTVIVVARSGQVLPDLPVGVLRVDDSEAYAGHGPLVAMVTGLSTALEAGATTAFLSGCDAPFLTAAHVSFVHEMLARDEHVHAVVPNEGTTKLHVLAGAVRVEPFVRIGQSLLVAGERRMSALFEHPSVKTVRVETLPDPRVVRPCNTPADWHAALGELDS